MLPDLFVQCEEGKTKANDVKTLLQYLKNCGARGDCQMTIMSARGLEGNQELTGNIFTGSLNDSLTQEFLDLDK